MYPEILGYVCVDDPCKMLGLFPSWMMVGLFSQNGWLCLSIYIIYIWELYHPITKTLLGDDDDFYEISDILRHFHGF